MKDVYKTDITDTFSFLWPSINQVQYNVTKTGFNAVFVLSHTY